MYAEGNIGSWKATCHFFVHLGRGKLYPEARGLHEVDIAQ